LTPSRELRGVMEQILGAAEVLEVLGGQTER